MFIKSNIFLLFICLLTVCSTAQNPIMAGDTLPFVQRNAAQTLMSSSSQNPLTIGMYGEVEYLKPQYQNGLLDVHRMVLLLGYRFDDAVQFITEIEMEHTTELYVEQAFANYNISDALNLRAGLLLIPMGIINEFHEPTTFNGVSRPALDTYLVPTTWREIGGGIAGRFDNIGLRYQLYVVNGFSSVTNGKVLNGNNGLRNGRQKGGKSIINSPNFSAKIDHYGFNNFRLGLSLYHGRTQSDYQIMDTEGADVGLSMLGLDARYSNGPFSARGQFIYAELSDTQNYNNRYDTDLGAGMRGWYLEAGYRIFDFGKNRSLTAFTRYENFDTHAFVDGIIKNDSYHRKIIITGLGMALSRGVVFKTDFQWQQVANSINSKQFNLGLGFWY